MVLLSHPYMTIGKAIALTRWTFVDKVMSLLYNMLSRLVITFLPRSKHLLISWLQSPSVTTYAMCMYVHTHINILYRETCVLAQLFRGSCLFTSPWIVVRQAPLFMRFSRQEYWSGLPFPSLDNFPTPGIEPASLAVSCFGRQILYHWRHPGSPLSTYLLLLLNV